MFNVLTIVFFVSKTRSLFFFLFFEISISCFFVILFVSFLSLFFNVSVLYLAASEWSWKINLFSNNNDNENYICWRKEEVSFVIVCLWHVQFNACRTSFSAIACTICCCELLLGLFLVDFRLILFSFCLLNCVCVCLFVSVYHTRSTNEIGAISISINYLDARGSNKCRLAAYDEPIGTFAQQQE